MPSFRGKIPNYQVWQLVAYVRSMSGLTPKASRVPREDDMHVKSSEAQQGTLKPKNAFTPAAAEMP
jgi:cytochrome c oxidase cbb3-type subunit 3